MATYLYLVLQLIFYRVCSLFIRKDEKAIVFGSWRGESFTDNSRYLAEYIGKNHPEYHLYWVGKKGIREQVESSSARLTFLEMGKVKTKLTILKCKYCFVSQKYHVDIARVYLLWNTTICYLHHGTPVKMWGDDGLNKHKAVSSSQVFRDRLKAKFIDYDYYASSSSLNSDILCSAMRSCNCKREKILSSGTPRNDILVNNSAADSERLKERYLKQLGIEGNPKVILYLPTYRRIDKNVFSFSKIDSDQLQKMNEILERHNAVIIEKGHFAEDNQIINAESRKNIYFANKSVNVQEMLLFCDAMISDYSGAFLDFTLLDRPIIHYAYDYVFYKTEDSGLYYDLEDFAAGPIAESFDDLCSSLNDILDGVDGYAERRRYVRNRFMDYERGNASKIIFNTIVLKNTSEGETIK